MQLKKNVFAALTVAIVAILPAKAGNTETFPMVRSPALAKFPNFVPNAKATVTVTSVGPVEIMSVFCSGLPPNTDFDFFVT
jgi:hypothetical protein